MPPKPERTLVRAIGRWSLTALVVNGVIGSAVFGLPSEITRLVGDSGPWVYLIAGAGTAAVIGCFAEAASQFPEAGGPYLYARMAYGQFWGIQMGWLNWLVRLTSAAANANLFVEYMRQFVPAAGESLVRAAILAVLVGILAVANLCGVKAGAGVSNFLAISKLVPLAVFIVAGLVLLHGPAPARSAAPLAALAPVSKDWLGAILLLVFAYGGFDSATFSMCEARNTRRDAPFALFTALGIVVVVYTLIQVVVLRALGGDPGGGAPLAAAARVFLGPAGTIFISAGALLSVYGNLSQSMLNSPRLTYALAERGDFPTVFAAIGRRFRTPYVSIIAFALVTFAFSLFASFRWNAVLAAVGRVFTYGIVCTAVLTLRSRQPQADAFRLPAAPLWIAVGLLFLGAAALRMGRSDLIAVSATSGLALAHWLAIRQRPSPPAA